MNNSDEAKNFKLDHIGIAVNDINESLKFYRDVLGLNFEKIEVVSEQKVKTASLTIGETHIELLEATETDSPVAKFIEKKGEGIHHIAIKVDNVQQYLDMLDENEIKLIDREPKKGANNKKIAFIHPKSTSGVLLELCQEEPDVKIPIL